MPRFLSQAWCDLVWTDWIPLRAPRAKFQSLIPRDPGLYRVRVVDEDALAYVGQTGRDLRERSRALAIHATRPANAPPWNDPHTAAPGLWAWTTENGLEYAISAAPAHYPRRERLAIESLLLYEYRLEAGESTLANHGRFHPGWRRPSNKGAGRAMKRLSPSAPNEAAGPSLSPVRGAPDPGAERWLGLDWSASYPLEEARLAAPAAPGVYRLLDETGVVYVGESEGLSKRLASHAHSYAGAALQASWCVMTGCLPHHRLERETDLIGAYYRSTGAAPRFQFGGPSARK